MLTSFELFNERLDEMQKLRVLESKVAVSLLLLMKYVNLQKELPRQRKKLLP